MAINRSKNKAPGTGLRNMHRTSLRFDILSARLWNQVVGSKIFFSARDKKRADGGGPSEGSAGLFKRIQPFARKVHDHQCDNYESQRSGLAKVDCLRTTCEFEGLGGRRAYED